MACHEADVCGGDELGGDGEVALVLPILIIDNDHEAATAVVLRGIGDAWQRGLSDVLWLKVQRCPDHRLKMISELFESRKSGGARDGDRWKGRARHRRGVWSGSRHGRAAGR